MFEIKLSQGAKPGKGGILPGGQGHDEEIAEIRGIPVGQERLSPNRHEEVDDWGDLLDMIAHVREVTGKPVGFKTAWVGSTRHFRRFLRSDPASAAPSARPISSPSTAARAAPARRRCR
jgi:glutamate synthase domain-containing protein 2